MNYLSLFFYDMIYLYNFLQFRRSKLKYLSYYQSKNLETPKAVFDYLMDTLKESIFTWDYFVDFKKSMSNADNVMAELDILDSLIGANADTIEAKFTNILKQNPSVRKVLPILIALRIEKMKDMTIIDNVNNLVSSSKKDLFDPRKELDSKMETDLVNFLKETGLKEFFVNQKVKSLSDYVRGIEVGMDTNARKNRTGTAMENILEKFISNLCKIHGLRYIKQATKRKIHDEWHINIELDKIDRRFDFAILNTKNKMFLIEVNYYSGGGSKLKATAGEYKYLYDFLDAQNLTFIWVTDGIGWHTAKTAMYETFLHNDYLFNLQMVAEGALTEILL